MDAHALEMKMVGKEPKNFKDGKKKKKEKVVHAYQSQVWK